METRTERLIHLIKKAQEEYAEENNILAIPGFMSKKFIAYCAMHEDLNLLLNYIEELTKEHNRIVKSSLTYAMLALYGKCFTDASKNSNPKLEPKSIFSNQKEFKETHDFLMDLRHQFIAHRGKTDSEIGIAFMVVPKENINGSQVRFKQLKQVSFGGEKLLEIKALIEYLIDELKKKIQKSGQKVYDGFFNSFSVEEMSFMVMNNVKEHPKPEQKEE
jgi:hypothetical protein